MYISGTGTPDPELVSFFVMFVEGKEFSFKINTLPWLSYRQLSHNNFAEVPAVLSKMDTLSTL